MKKDLKKKYLIPAAVCLIILCGIGYSYFFSSFSKEDKTVYLYLDQDDTYDSLVVKVQPIAKRQSFHALCTLARHSNLIDHIRPGRYEITPSMGTFKVWRHLKTACRNHFRSPFPPYVPCPTLPAYWDASSWKTALHG